MKKLNTVLLVTTVAIALCACTSDSNSEATQPSTSPSAATPAPEPASSTNSVPADAVAAYRSALKASGDSLTKDGITELWFDTDETIVQVLVFDPASNQYLAFDATEGTSALTDESELIPARLSSELDGLIAGNLDTGSVSVTDSGEIVVVDIIDEVKYQTFYTLDQAGRLKDATLLADDENLGLIEFHYEITVEGETALAALNN